jgi:phage tail protein X
MSASLSPSDLSELQYWLDSSTSLVHDSDATPGDDDTWLLELHDCANQGLFLSTLTLTLYANVLAEIIQVLHATPPLKEITPPFPTLSPDLHDPPAMSIRHSNEA